MIDTLANYGNFYNTVPGQGGSTQLSVIFDMLSQYPPFSSSLIFDLIRFCVPEPHVTEHSPSFLQRLHSQSTMIRENFEYFEFFN